MSGERCGAQSRGVLDALLICEQVAGHVGPHVQGRTYWDAVTARPAGQETPGAPSEEDLEATARTLGWLTHVLDETYKPEGVVLWMTGRNRYVDGQRPIALLLRGGRDGVAQVLNAACAIEGGWG